MYELASQGLPPAVVEVIDNQQDDIREFTAGFALSIGAWNTPDLVSKIAEGLRRLWLSSERQSRSDIGRREVVVDGAERLVAACLKHWSDMPTDV